MERDPHWLRVAARRIVVLDLDGVVYEGSRAIPGAAEAIARMQAAGYRFGFLTNNSGSDPSRVIEKLRSFGIACGPESLMTSGLGAAILLGKERARLGSLRVHVVGSSALRQLVSANGVDLVESGDADLLLVGLDAGFDYRMLSRALDTVSRGARLWACNRDASYPADGGRLLPGCGPIVAAIETACGRRANVVVGKPERLLLDLLLVQLGETTASCVVVGDGLDSDIAMARSCGIPAVWVTSVAKNDSVVSVASLSEFAERVMATRHQPPFVPDSNRQES